MTSDDGKPSGKQATNEALVATTRLTDMMGRVPFNLSEALKPENADGVVGAIEVCSVCGNGARCDEWVVSHPEGEGHALPDFCGNQKYLKSFPPKPE